MRKVRMELSWFVWESEGNSEIQMVFAVQCEGKNGVELVCLRKEGNPSNKNEKNKQN